MISVGKVFLVATLVTSCAMPEKTTQIDWVSEYREEIESYCNSPIRDSSVYSRNGFGFVCIIGPINDDLTTEIIESTARFRNNDEIVVYVDTVGGNESAIELAYTLSRYDYKLIAKNNCISACANYILAGARRAFVANNTKVGWHGGIPRSKSEYLETSRISLGGNLDSSIGNEDAIHEGWKSLEKLVRIQEKVFEINSVDPAITYESFDHVYRCTYDNSEAFRTVVENDNGVQSAYWSPSFTLLRDRYGFDMITFENPGEFQRTKLNVVTNSGREYSYDVPLGCVNTI